MFCKNCGMEIADDSKFCMECGAELTGVAADKPIKSIYSTKHKKLILVITGILLMSFIIGAVVWRQSTAWQRDFTLKYIGHESPSYGSSYKLYEITNNTSRTIKDIRVIIQITNGFPNKKWEIEKTIHAIGPRETIEYEVLWAYIKESANEKDIELVMAEYEIKKLVY